MKKFFSIAIILVVAVISAAVYFIFIATKSQEKKLKELEKEITFLKEEIVPVRYKILSQEDDKIEISVKFYDLDGNEFVKQKFELPGTVASFDFYVVKMNERYIAFPYKIFTDKIKPEDAELLFKYYEKDNFPMIFYSESSSKIFKDGIEILYQKIKNNDLENIESIFGNMVQNAPQTMEKGAEGSVFKIVVHTKGGIELIEE